jgi:protein CMS1
MSDSESDGGVPLIDAEFDPTASSKKRKRDAEPEAAIDSKKAAKKLKRKEKKKQKAKEIDEDDLDQKLGVNHSFERMDGQLVADYINARTRLYGKDLSSVELEDKFIPGAYDVLLASIDADRIQPARCEIVRAGRSHELRTTYLPS